MLNFSLNDNNYSFIFAGICLVTNNDSNKKIKSMHMSLRLVSFFK